MRRSVIVHLLSRHWRQRRDRSRLVPHAIRRHDARLRRCLRPSAARRYHVVCRCRRRVPTVLGRFLGSPRHDLRFNPHSPAPVHRSFSSFVFSKKSTPRAACGRRVLVLGAVQGPCAKTRSGSWRFCTGPAGCTGLARASSDRGPQGRTIRLVILLKVVARHLPVLIFVVNLQST